MSADHYPGPGGGVDPDSMYGMQGPGPMAMYMWQGPCPIWYGHGPGPNYSHDHTGYNPNNT